MIAAVATLAATAGYGVALVLFDDWVGQRVALGYLIAVVTISVVFDLSRRG